jgi:hypothetical protein
MDEEGFNGQRQKFNKRPFDSDSTKKIISCETISNLYRVCFDDFITVQRLEDNC